MAERAGYQFQIIADGRPGRFIATLVMRKPGRDATEAFEGFAGNVEGIVCHPGGAQATVPTAVAVQIDAEMRRLLDIRYNSPDSNARREAMDAMRRIEAEVERAAR